VQSAAAAMKIHCFPFRSRAEMRGIIGDWRNGEVDMENQGPGWWKNDKYVHVCKLWRCCCGCMLSALCAVRYSVRALFPSP
jgi:hypothetical protein